MWLDRFLNDTVIVASGHDDNLGPIYWVLHTHYESMNESYYQSNLPHRSIIVMKNVKETFYKLP